MVRIGKLFLVSFLFIIVLGLGSSVLASTSDNIRRDLQKLGAANVIGSTVYEDINLSGFDDYSHYAILVCNGVQEDSGVTYRAYKLTTTRRLYICANNGGSLGNSTNQKDNVLYYGWSGGSLNKSYNYTTGAYVTSSSSFEFNSMVTSTAYVYSTMPINTRRISLPDGGEFGGDYLSGPTVTFEFEPRFYRNIDISGENFYCYNYSRSVSLWTIGYCHGLSDYNYVGGDLYVFVDTNVLDNIGGFIYRSQDLIQNGVLNLSSSGLLSVNQSKILYNQGYALNFFLRDKEGNSYWLDEPIYLYFKPLGDTSTSGDLISPDLDNNTDVGFVNLLDDYFASPSGNTEYEISGFLGFPSGDFSGDMFGILGSVDLSRFNDDYGTGTYLRQIFLQVINSLAGEGNQQLTFDLHGRTYTINSNDFVVPNGVFKSFITMLLVAGTLLLIYWQVRGILLSFRTLNLTAAVRSFDVDYSLFM